ncbi:MAG: hypothetical protein HWN65_08390 [Candidatus Helarchaeota archaeon]|nr:hypothetical protein [Candidatus Helarchaeota archaeon]
MNNFHKLIIKRGAKAFGRHYWGKVGEEVFKRLDFYTRKHFHTILAAPQGFGKTRMLKEYFKHFCTTSYKFLDQTSVAAILGTVESSRGKIVNVSIPPTVRFRFTIIPDLSAMLRDQRVELKKFQLNLNMLVDAEKMGKSVSIKLAKVGGQKYKKDGSPLECVKEAEDYGITFDMDYMTYDSSGILILCFLNTFLEKLETDTLSRFQKMVYGKGETIYMFNYLLRHSFLPRYAPPKVPKEWIDRIQAIFPPDLKTPRELTDFMHVAGGSQDERCGTQLDEMDFEFAMGNLYKNYGWQKKHNATLSYRQYIVFHLKNFYGYDEIRHILGLSEGRIRHIVSQVKKKISQM